MSSADSSEQSGSGGDGWINIEWDTAAGRGVSAHISGKIAPSISACIRGQYFYEWQACLYLCELRKARIYLNGKVLSMQESYACLVPKNVCNGMALYFVFAHLLEVGYFLRTPKSLSDDDTVDAETSNNVVVKQREVVPKIESGSLSMTYPSITV